MIRYHLRTLLIVLALGPLVLWGCWLASARRSSLYIPAKSIDVGVVKNGTVGCNYFRIGNRGSRNVRLTRIDPGDLGGLSAWGDLVIRPGETWDFRVEWTTQNHLPRDAADSSILGRLRMKTDDLRQPLIEFTIVGRSL